MTTELTGSPSGPAASFDADLASIDFANILGGPMCAAVNAQAQSAMVTLNYIQSVGFTKGGGAGSAQQVQSVEFDYTKSSVDPTTGAVTPEQRSLTVPILSIVPIPFLRVSQLSVDLNVKLDSVTTSSTSNDFVTNTNFSSGGFLSLFSPVKFSGTISDKKSSSATGRTEESYSLQVKMLATQDAMPAGLAKVLQILEDAIGAK